MFFGSPTKIFALFFALSITNAQATEICYFLSVPCDTDSRDSMPSIGSALPSYSDAFNINPAALPTVPTPLGLEGTFSTGGTSGGLDKNYGVIKGFNRVGAGLSTNSDNTFYGFNEEQALAGTQFASVTNQLDLVKSKNPSINAGGALDFFGEALQKKLALPVIGANLRYNRMTKKWDQGVGVSIAGKVLHVGVGMIRQQAAVVNGFQVPETSMPTLGIGLKFGSLHFEYTMLPSMLTPVSILTSTFSGDKLSWSLAARQFNNVEAKQVTQYMASAQYKFTKKVRLGYLYGYVTNAHSANIQWLF